MNRLILRLLFSFTIAGSALGDNPAGDLERLQGTWRTVKGYSIDGVELTLDQIREHDATKTFRGDRMINRSRSKSGYGEFSGRITLDPSLTPKAIDLIVIEGSPPVKDIYLIDKNTLKPAWGITSKAERPTIFSPCPNDSEEKWAYDIYEKIIP